jgi:hypothetical protein
MTHTGLGRRLRSNEAQESEASGVGERFEDRGEVLRRSLVEPGL